MGPVDLHDYTVTADVKAAGGTAKLPDIGLIAQRLQPFDRFQPSAGVGGKHNRPPEVAEKAAQTGKRVAEHVARCNRMCVVEGHDEPFPFGSSVSTSIYAAPHRLELQSLHSRQVFAAAQHS